MRKSRFSDSQILAMIKQNEDGTSVNDIRREHSVSQTQFYKWRAKFDLAWCPPVFSGHYF